MSETSGNNVKSRDDCAICLRGLLCHTSDGKSLVPLGSAHPCGHCFHTECFERLQRSNTSSWNTQCPVCRTRIASFERIFLQSQQVDRDPEAAATPEEESSTTNHWGNLLGVAAGAAGLLLTGFLVGRATTSSEKKQQRGDNNDE